MTGCEPSSPRTVRIFCRKDKEVKMKTKATLALASLIAAPAYANVEMPHIYGRADVSINSTEEAGSDSAIQTNSNASRLGFHNTHALTDSLDVFYRLEYEVNFDERLRSEDRDMLRQRNSIVGLKGTWGSVFVGVHDTPFKKAELKVDQFSDYHLADIDEVIGGQDRISDTINYMSPKFGNLQFWAMLIPGDDEATAPGTDSGGGADGSQGDGLADAVSASVTYKHDKFQLAFAINSEIDARDSFRLSGQTKLGMFQLGALIQQSENSDGSGTDGVAYVLSGAMNITSQTKLKLQWASADEDSVEASPGSDLLVAGVDHKLAKTTKVYAYYSDRSNDVEAEEFSTIGVGIQHNFGQAK